jgi:hypothetical protein
MRRRALRVLYVASALCVLMPDGDVAGDGNRSLYTTATPFLQISAHPLPGSDGGTTSVQLQLVPETQNHDIYVTLGSNEDPFLCAVSSGTMIPNGPRGQGPPPGALIDWRFRPRLQSSDSARARIDLHWTRTVNVPAAVDADTIERRYDLSLLERTHEVLDIVRPPPGTSSSCEGYAIEAELVYRDEPDLENALLQYDVWLIDTDASGKQATDHLEPRGLQGREIEYAFRPQRFDFDGNRNSSGPVSSRLEGSVKGRVRPDGRIDLVVSVLRVVQSDSLGIGDGGGKKVTVSDGETIEVTTPRLSGDVPGVPADSNLFRAGHTAIRVTARRIS